MTAKEKVLKIDPMITGFWDSIFFKVYSSDGKHRLGFQSRENWAWAEAYRNLISKKPK